MKKRRFMYIYIQYSSQKQKWPNFEQYCFVAQSLAKKHHLKDGRYPINKGMFDSQSHPYMAAVWPAKSRLAPSTGGDICPQRRVKAVLVTSGDVWSKNQQHWFLGMRIIVRKVGWFYVWGLLACVFSTFCCWWVVVFWYVAPVGTIGRFARLPLPRCFQGSTYILISFLSQCREPASSLGFS